MPVFVPLLKIPVAVKFDTPIAPDPVTVKNNPAFAEMFVSPFVEMFVRFPPLLLDKVCRLADKLEIGIVPFKAVAETFVKAVPFVTTVTGK